RAHDNIQHHNTLIFSLARFLRKLRLRSKDWSRRAYALAYVKYSRAYAGTAMSRSNATAIAAANTAAHANAVGRRHQLRKRIAYLCVWRSLYIGDHRRFDHQLALLLDQYGWWSELLLRCFRRHTGGRFQFAGIAATSAAGAAFTHFHRYVGRQFH